MASTAPRPRYRDFMTPALHRRFTSASLYTLGLCYINAVWMGHADFIWKFLPFGPAGVRTLMLFISALTIYILRVSQMHIGERTTTAPYETFTKYLVRLETVQTLVFYTFSAWWFSEVYIWAQPPESKLGWIDAGKYHERIRLNERPIYFRFLFLCLAVVQSAVHLFADYDRIVVPVLKVKRGTANTTISSVDPAATQLLNKNSLARLLERALYTTITVLFGGSFLYFVFLRMTLWDWYFAVARHAFSLGRTGKPGGVNFPTIWLKFVTEGCFLVTLWRFTNKTFDVYVGQEPLKNGKPITDDSKDPNGSLLNGLKAKKEVPRSVAFWELVLITTRFDDRRKTIYEELGRDTREESTWDRIRTVCLAEIQEITKRIDAVTSPQPAPGATANPPVLDLVPRISQPLKEDKILGSSQPVSTMGKFEQIASDLAKTKSAPPGSGPRPDVRLLEFGSSVMAKSGLKPSNHPSVQHGASDLIMNFIRSPFGIPFRQSFRRTVNVVVAGTPYSRTSTIADAATALAGLVACSLKEDKYGRVQKDVPDIIRAFVAAIKTTDAFAAALPVHWTDIDFVGKSTAEKQNVPEVKQVVDALSDGLTKILLAWVEFLDNCGLSRTEVREAKALAERGSPEK